MGFGKHIKNLRNKKRISAEKLAIILGVDADRLRKWEAKDMSPRENDTRSIENAFGMKMDEILNLEELPDFQKVQNRGEFVTLFKSTAEETLQQKAIVRTLLHATSKMMAKVYGRDVSDCMDELEQTTMLNLREMRDAQ